MATGCKSVTLSNIDGRCDTSTGGIKRILISNRDDVTASIGTTTNEFELITEIKNATGKAFSEWKFRKNTGSYTSTVESDPAIGNMSVTTECTLQFSRAEAEKRMAIQSALNADSVVIIEDMYGQYLYLGYENEVTVTAATMVSGTTTSDLSGFTITFQDLSTELPHFVDSEKVDVDGLLTAGA